MGSNGVDTHVPKVAIVTGGASGIGLAMSRHFAAEGYNVAIWDINVSDGQEASSKIASENPKAKVIFKQCDVSSWQNQAQSFKEVYRELGRIDLVCANAGISEQGESALGIVEEDEPAEPNLKIMDVNLCGVIYSVKLAMHYMRKNELSVSSRGSIICTASNAGLYPFPVSPLYAATKAGVIGLVRSTAPVAQRNGIQINGLAPAVLMTNLAPSKDLFANMIVTPMSTLLKGVAQLVSDPTLSGEVAEIHGTCVTLRPFHEYVDEDSRKNLDNFWNLGYA
ncbi:unnamed protein product [Discula destructiva]